MPAGIQLDVTDRDSFANFIETIEREVGPIDVLVNNAGIMPAGPFLDEPDSVIDTQIDVNFRGPIIGMRAVLPLMIKRGRGHVVNVASMAGKFPVPGLAVYSGTKHAVVGLSSSIRDELAGTGVSISTVMPNAVRTELTSGLPTERIGILKPEQVAEAIVGSVDNRREEIAVPRWYGALPCAPGASPDPPARGPEEAGSASHRLLDHTRIDRKTRDKYDERIADSSSRARQERVERRMTATAAERRAGARRSAARGNPRRRAADLRDQGLQRDRHRRHRRRPRDRPRHVLPLLREQAGHRGAGA